jgi:Family of unknown function (DUF6088)
VHKCSNYWVSLIYGALSRRLVSAFLSELCIHASDERNRHARTRNRPERQYHTAKGAGSPFGVWVPADFADLGPRDTVDQVLHRLVRAGIIRRVTRGLYDKPHHNTLTDKSTHPDPRSVIDTLARRDSARMIVDGITAANDIGLPDAVPAPIIVHTDARLKSLALGNFLTDFKKTALSKLFWAGRPAMRVVQALHWLRDTKESDAPRVRKRLQSIFDDPVHGSAITADLRNGLSTLAIWIQFFSRDLIVAPDGFNNHDVAAAASKCAT